MFYHASPVPGLHRLEPRSSNHGVPLVYFSKKRENVLVYLSNAVERCCLETGFAWDGPWQKWGPYGFDGNGRLRLEEYYPDALRRTYAGVSGYIYAAETIPESDFPLHIPDAAASAVPVDVGEPEFVPDAYEAILEAERRGLLAVLRYEDSSPTQHRWLRETIPTEYVAAEAHPEYRHFLRWAFPDLIHLTDA